ncbi:hypothetical protein [Streptomyces sp. NPDC020141]|uniref:hypothetical protein n=1 Tax=Streptomyces sp. NPDC020141 TaxID=3365065 RepID=UPI003787BAE9
MTNREPQQPAENDDQEHDADVLDVHERMVVTERLVSTTCAWCGDPIDYDGVGRPPKYCRDSHRKRASEMRTAERRAARPVEEGGRTTEPVREVVERTETLLRTTVRRGPSKVRLPEDIYEWQQALRQLRDEVQRGRLAGFYDLLLRDLEATAAAVRDHRDEQRRREALPVPAPRSPRPQGSRKKRRKRR